MNFIKLMMCLLAYFMNNLAFIFLIAHPNISYLLQNDVDLILLFFENPYIGFSLIFKRSNDQNSCFITYQNWIDKENIFYYHLFKFYNEYFSISKYLQMQ